MLIPRIIEVPTVLPSATIDDTGSDVRSATGVVVVTGTSTITRIEAETGGVSTEANVEKVLQFDDSLTLTHNATYLSLPIGQNIQTSAGDRAVFQCLGNRNWQCIQYHFYTGAIWQLAPTAGVPFLSFRIDRQGGYNDFRVNTGTAGDELLITNVGNTNNVLALRSAAADWPAGSPMGFSAVAMRTNTDMERCAIGYGNSGYPLSPANLASFWESSTAFEGNAFCPPLRMIQTTRYRLPLEYAESASAGAATKIYTQQAHGFTSGATVTFADILLADGVTSSGINGSRVVTVIDSTSFTVPVAYAAIKRESGTCYITQETAAQHLRFELAWDGTLNIWPRATVDDTDPTTRLIVVDPSLPVVTGMPGNPGAGYLELRGGYSSVSITLREGGNPQTIHRAFGGTLGGTNGHRFYTGGEVNSQTEKLQIADNGVEVKAVPLYLQSYTVAGLPSASKAGGMIYVSNETGGAVPAFSDGTNWRRVTDRAIVS
jgi:hypothetical protein